MNTVKLVGAVLLALFALVMWYAFIRRVPEESGTGTIAGKYFKPAGTYTLQHPGLERGFRLPTSIPIEASYIFDVELDGSGEHGAFALNELAAGDYAEGQRVRVRYIRRGIPPFWQRTMVTSMEPLEPR